MLRAVFASSVIKPRVLEAGRLAKAGEKGSGGKGGAKPPPGTALRGSGGKKKGGEGEDGNMKLFIKTFEQPGPQKYTRDEAQMKKDMEIAKEYTRQSFIRHNALQKSIARKIRLRDIAISALPAELQKEGKSEDLEPFPAERSMWTDFPPIPGFQSSQSKEAQ